MDAQQFIESHTKSVTADFSKAYKCEFRNTLTTRLSDTARLSGMKIFFDKVRHTVHLGRGKRVVVNSVLWNAEKNVRDKESVEESLAEVDDVVADRLCATTAAKTLAFGVEYVIKDNEVISHCVRTL